MAEEEKFNHWEAIQQFSENVSPIDFYLIFENWRMFLDGAVNTVILVSLGLFFAGFIAIPLAVCQVSRVPILSRIVGAYTYFFRGTPLLLQLYLIYYGFSEIDFIRNGMLWVIFKDAWLCTLVAFTINSAAYTTEILRGAFEQIPDGEVEAAKACGMSAWKRYTRIILPSGFRRALPAYSNEVIFMIHGSVVASTVTIIDILGAGRILNGRYYLAYEGFIAAAVLYMIIVFLVTRGFNLWEKQWFAHLRPRET